MNTPTQLSLPWLAYEIRKIEQRFADYPNADYLVFAPYLKTDDDGSTPIKLVAFSYMTSPDKEYSASFDVLRTDPLNHVVLTQPVILSNNAISVTVIKKLIGAVKTGDSEEGSSLIFIPAVAEDGYLYYTIQVGSSAGAADLATEFPSNTSDTTNPEVKTNPCPPATIS